MGRRARQGGRPRAILDEIQHIGPNAVVVDKNRAHAAKVEIVRSIDGVDPTRQGQRGICIRIDPRRGRQTNHPRPRVIVVHVAQRPIVIHAQSRQP